MYVRVRAFGGAECAEVVDAKPPSSEILPQSHPREQGLTSQFPLYVKGSEQSKEVIRLALIEISMLDSCVL